MNEDNWNVSGHRLHLVIYQASMEWRRWRRAAVINRTRNLNSARSRLLGGLPMDL